MVEDRIGYRYAKSLFSLAEEKNMLDASQEDMTVLTETFKGSSDLVRLLESPLVSGSKKQAVLDAVFGGKYKSELTEALVKMIVSKGREQFLPLVAKGFVELYDAKKGIERGLLTTATPLSKKQLEAIQQGLEEKSGKKYDLEVAVDPDLIGGFTLKLGHTLFDGSIASSLRKVKRAFQKN
ncbi:MAG: ATP synthase F1 subunit delta [Bacteroidota bacterium]